MAEPTFSWLTTSEVGEVAAAIEESFRREQRIPQPAAAFWNKIARAALERVEIIRDRGTKVQTASRRRERGAKNG